MQSISRYRNRYYFHPISEEIKPITEEHQAEPVEIEQLTTQEWFERGFFFGQDNNHNEVFRCFDNAIHLRPRYAEDYFNLGLSQRYRGNNDEAIIDYSEAIRLKPDFAEAFNCRVSARLAKVELIRAIEDYNKAIEIQSDYPNARHNWGIVFFSVNHDNLSAFLDIQK